MYDILQLNDMLVPELLDIAEQLKIPNAKKLDKQELVYKILDKQAVVSSEKGEMSGDKPKRKRIVKTSTANSNEEAFVESGGDSRSKKPELKKDNKKKDDKLSNVNRKIKKKDDFVESDGSAEDRLSIHEDENLADSQNQDEEIAELVPDEAEASPESNRHAGDQQQNKVYPQRRNDAFNIEF